MGLIPPELSLDCRPTFVPRTIAEFLGEMSMIGDASERVCKIDDYVRRLEDEMRKIDAFKRELPLCMLLVNDGKISCSLCVKKNWAGGNCIMFWILHGFGVFMLFS